jgi:predicted phosphodiesterase
MSGGVDAPGPSREEVVRLPRRTHRTHGAAWCALLVLGLLTVVTGCTNPQRSTAPNGTPTQPGGRVTGPAAGPVVTIAGDIAGGQRKDKETAKLVEAIDPDYVLTAGDNAYTDGTRSDYEKYDETWGRFKDKTYPAPGNHDYHEEAGDPPYYYTYFADQLPDENDGQYYAFNVGKWRLYSLNCEISCSDSSDQAEWLQEDLATAGEGRHKMAYLHRPRYSCGTHGSSDEPEALWEILLDARADLVVAGHDHNYQRYPRMDADGDRTDDGIISFVVGTGGSDFYEMSGKESEEGCSISRARDDDDAGVLKLTLGKDSVTWAMISVGNRVLDQGTEPTLDEVGSASP